MEKKPITLQSNLLEYLSNYNQSLFSYRAKTYLYTCIFDLHV